MHVKSIGLAWIIVKDFDKAVKFYRDVVGLKLVEINEEWGWAELEGHEEEGSRLGIALSRSKSEDHIQPGENAVVTFTVDNLEKGIEKLEKQGAQLVGDIEIIPGHVKMQGIRDNDGNFFQIVELLSEHMESKHQTDNQNHGCCGGH